MATIQKIHIAQRRRDTGVVDTVAIDLALRGWPSYARDLSERELRVAIHNGKARRLSSKKLAELLLTTPRQVERYYSQPCPVEELPDLDLNGLPELALIAA